MIRLEAVKVVLCVENDAHAAGLRAISESPIMRRFSSSVVCSARSTCASQVLPTIVTVFAPDASNPAAPGLPPRQRPFCTSNRTPLSAHVAAASPSRAERTRCLSGSTPGSRPLYSRCQAGPSARRCAACPPATNVLPSHCSHVAQCRVVRVDTGHEYLLDKPSRTGRCQQILRLHVANRCPAHALLWQEPITQQLPPASWHRVRPLKASNPEPVAGVAVHGILCNPKVLEPSGMFRAV